ncbi:MAG: hypothetical protein COT18_10885, partial [Elusimicrobia bacterium CG08_land_8_20_14_0_20_59_10]
MSAYAYLMDSSSRTYTASSHPPRSVVYLAEYYAAETAVKSEVLRYCSAAGAAASAECTLAMAPGARAIYDGRRVYLVSGGRVAKLDNAALAEAAGLTLADNG